MPSLLTTKPLNALIGWDSQDGSARERVRRYLRQPFSEKELCDLMRCQLTNDKVSWLDKVNERWNENLGRCLFVRRR